MTQVHVGSRIIQSFHHFLQYYQSSRLTCGVILARTDLSQAGVNNIKDFLEKKEPHTAFQISYDSKENILGILLDECNLGYTHFYALYVKEFLEQQDCLTGGLLVGSFPENSDHAEQMLFDMLWELIDGRNESNGIRVYQEDQKYKTTGSVLLVDNDQSILQLLARYLESKGYEVHTATDGKKGLHQYQNYLPDLVITEINLSALDGYQFINQVKNLDEHYESDSKIMVLTNKQREEDIKRTFEYGVSEYITKPFSLIELEARMKRLVEA